MKKKRSSPSVWLRLIGLILTAIVGIGGILYLLRTQENPSMPQSSHVTDELQRAKSLLSPRRIKNATLTEVPPDPSPAAVGAQDGIGYKASKSGLTFNVYVFEDWDASSKAVNTFTSKHANDGNVYAATAMNGALVFYGVVRTDTKDATANEFQMDEFLSAFSGDE